MPTPSSHDGNDSLSFNSTCPDEQVPRAPSVWLHPPPPYESDDQQQPQPSQRNEATVGSGSGSGSGSAGEIGESQTSPTDDAAGSAHSTPALSPNAEPSSDASPMPLTESMFSRDSEHDAEPEEDDDANKHTDADEDMPDNITHPEESAEDRDVSAETETETIRSHESESRSNTDRRPSGREAPRFNIPGTELWESYGVNQAHRRRFDIASIGPAFSRSAATAVAGEPLQLSNVEGDKVEEGQSAGDLAWFADPSLYMGCDPTGVRLIPTAPSTFLRPGSRFMGTQQSERQVYDVQVEIKHVDLRESFLCGYLRIQGLTEDHPTLTTYFEGEIIGSKYGFTTKHKSWGANDRIDMSHWAKFAAFRQFAKQAKKGNGVIKEYLQKENIFMRWKEHFLVPDHRVKTILGASFEGFYYICFNQVEGVVHGIYFHSKSEKFQQLELKHIEDKGCMSALEFR